MNLFVLPDELWISILHEWINKPILLCAFDMALCNRLLRDRYLMWLHDETTRGTFNIFSHIHFETTLEYVKHDMSQQGVSDTFFDWCKKRQINPKSLSYCLEPTNEISKKASKAMKQVEQLNAYYRFDNKMANTDFVSNILNDCPKLKKLVVNLPEVIGYQHCSDTLTFSCKESPYLLVDVDFIRVRFPLSSDSFVKFVDACPNLEKVKFDMCTGIHLCHILYLLNHTNALKSIYVCFTYHSRDMGNVNMNEIEEEATNNNINTTMKSLILRNLGSLDDVSNASYLLSIFKKCPMLEKVVVEVCNIRQNHISVVAWCEMIANNWQHLRSLTLQYAVWMTNNELMMNALESCCGKELKEFSIEGKVTNELIARICRSFVALESLKLPFDAMTIIQYPVLLQSFQQARFRNTLHTFKVPGRGRFDITSNENKPFDFADILNCFPALHTIDLITTSTLHIVEPFAAIPQVKECTFRFDSILGFSQIIMNMMKDFIHLKKLTLQNMLLDGTALSSILTLPQLEHLSFRGVYGHDGTEYFSLLHPNQYPSIHLAPLKEFAFVEFSNYVTRYHFQQEHVRTFLQRFVSLERLIIQDKAIEDEELSELRQEYRYRTMITTTL